MSSLVDSASLGGGGGAAGLPGSAGQQRDELKTQFMTREGLYKLMTLSEYSRPNRVGYANTAANPGAPVRVSFALPTLPQQQQSKSAKAAAIPNGSLGSTSTASSSTGSEDQTNKGGGGSSEVWSGEKIAFNYGREIFVYPYKGVKKAADLTKPIDKRIYKGTSPTCHDFGSVVAAADASSGGEGVIPMLVGFTGGQIQLVDPVRKELSKLYNEERLVEQSRVTCIKWIPGTPNLFLVSYSSGFMYVYNHELICPPTAPVYQTFMQGEGYAVHTCKTKTTRNPLYRWTIGTPPSGSSSSSNQPSSHSSPSPSAVNEFAFSPCGKYLAVVSADGYLRVFYYNTMKLTGQARSYFGSLLCVAWSPDGKYIVTGGEDDLVNVYSVSERRVVVRGQGHRSWVSVVAFDSYNMSYGAVPDGLDFSGSDEEGSSMNNGSSRTAADSMPPPPTRSSMPFQPTSDSASYSASAQHVTCYRFGSVGEDTHICLWDMTEDTLKKASAASAAGAAGSSADLNTSQSGGDDCQDSSGPGNSNAPGSVSGAAAASSSSSNAKTSNTSSSSSGGNSLTSRLAALSFGGGDKKEHKRNFSLPSRSSGDKASSSAKGATASQTSQASLNGSSGSSFLAAGGGKPSRLEHVRLGTPQCPRLSEVPLIEPLVMKKIAHERLTELIFREECLVTACQDGYVCTWARPGKRQQQQQHANHQQTGGAGLSTGGYPMTCPGSPPATGGGSAPGGAGGGGTIV